MTPERGFSDTKFSPDPPVTYDSIRQASNPQCNRKENGERCGYRSVQPRGLVAVSKWWVERVHRRPTSSRNRRERRAHFLRRFRLTNESGDTLSGPHQTPPSRANRFRQNGTTVASCTGPDAALIRPQSTTTGEAGTSALERSPAVVTASGPDSKHDHCQNSSCH